MPGGEIIDPDSDVAHLLRAGGFPNPVQHKTIETVIIGGGISGLSAARWLIKNNYSSFCLLELSSNTGGNSCSGKNDHTEYPWAAHYLPLPNPECKELLEFLTEVDAITGRENDLPVFNETYLCFDPQERLFIHGKWQDGLVPDFGLQDHDRAEMERFLKTVDQLRNKKGLDNKYAFAIPVDESSEDADFRELDKMTAAAYLKKNQYTSAYLYWYLEYCCKDDFGTDLNTTSAWAALHYFASRRGVGANAEAGSVLTWPEGNAFLAKQMTDLCKDQIQAKTLVYKCDRLPNDHHLLHCYDALTKVSYTIEATQIITAVPQFVNARIFTTYGLVDAGNFSYSPWLIANLTVNDWPYTETGPLPWDSVQYGSKSLGYVDATHQHLHLNKTRKTLTWYYAVADEQPKLARAWLRQQQHSDLCAFVLSDLKRAHPNCEQYIEKIDFRIWGHAMIRPEAGFMWQNRQREAIKNQAVPGLHFAHSDLSGISIFEEAFYAGINAASAVLKALQ